MPQSTAALRQKADLLRLLRNPASRVQASPTKGHTPQRPVWARKQFECKHGVCLALDLRDQALWVLVRDAKAQEAWAPALRVLSPDQCRQWARTGF